VITSAYVQFTVDEVSSGATSLEVQAEAADDAAAFTSVRRNVSSRPRTEASVSWSPVPWTVRRASGPEQRTPDLAAILQEVVSRPGWASGRSLALIITGTGKRVAHSKEKSSGIAPVLHVEYRQ
jgi:hypothetical protein